MECSIGVAFKDFVLLATDASCTMSIIVMKHDEEKVFKLSDHLMMAVSGESGDTSQFAEYISKNVQLYKMRNDYQLSPSAAAHFTRQNLAQSLRSRSPYQVNLLLAGFDKDAGGELYYMDYLGTMAKCQMSPYQVNLLLAGFDKDAGGELYYMDYLGTMAKVNYGTHGYGGMFSTSIMDRYFRKDMNEEEAYNLLKLCVSDIHRRLLVNLARFHVHIVDKNGIRKLEPLVIEGEKLVLGKPKGEEPMAVEVTVQ